MKSYFQYLTPKYAKKVLILCVFFTLFAGTASAASTFTWKGTSGNDWRTPGNWTKTTAFFQTASTSTYPGEKQSDDMVAIGTTTYTTNQPTVMATPPFSIASIEFGDNGNNAMTLMVNSGFTLTAVTVVLDGSNSTIDMTLNLSGSGTIACTSLDVGDGSTVPSNGANSIILNSTLANFKVTGTLTLVSTRSGTKFNNPVFNLNSGILTVTNIATSNKPSYATGNTTTFNMGTSAIANTLNVSGSITVTANTGASFSFLSAAANASASTVNYSGAGSQTVLTEADAFVVSTPMTYGNLSFSNAGTKTVDATAVTIGNDWTTSGGTVNLTAHDPAVTVSGDWNNTAPITMGAGTVTITGDLNNTSNTITGNTTAATLTVNGALVNGGTINAGAENATFKLASTNTGTYTGGAGTIAFTSDLNNSVAGSVFTEGAGAATIGGNLSNAGTINGNTVAATSTVTGTTTNTGTIKVNTENMTFTGLVTNSGTYTGSAGTSKFTTGLTNTGSVTEGAGTFTIGNLINNAGTFTGNTTTASTTSITGTLANAATITVNYENITVTGAATNTGTCADGTGTGAITFGNSYTNSGTFTASAIFNAAGAQTLTDNSATGTLFANVQFQNSGTKTLAGSKGFAVSSSGTLTMAGTTTLAAGGLLTLNSDASGSAIVAAVPATCTISGNVNVQRYIDGSAANKRGYRLMSSSVFSGTPTVGTNVYDLSYLTASGLWVSGPGYAANGFNVTTTANPSVYLFREDITPPQSTSVVFTTGYNWKGVAKINDSPLYNIGTQAKTTTVNVDDFTTTIPVGNGFLLFYRGDNSSTAGKTVAPFTTAPGSVTLTDVGQLNTGTINVKPWYTGTTGLTYTASSTTTGTNLLIRGFALVGNPYAATINWELYNNTHLAGALTGTLGSLTIYEFDPASGHYEFYTASSNANITGERPSSATHYSGSATNFIASGMGFFVTASAAGQTLTFTENAKVTTNGSPTQLNVLMGKPIETAQQLVPAIRLKLIKDSVNSEDIVIGLSSTSSTKYVINEDVLHIGDSAPEHLYSFSSDSIPLALNMLPFPGKQPQIINLLTDATASGSYNLTVPQLENMPQVYDVWLKDSFTADSVQLKLNTSYPFTIDKSNAATFGSNRFTVVIRQDSAYTYKLLDFTATKVDHQTDVQLVWKTANEENYTRFTVERSTDNGKTFNPVGGMLGTGAGNYSLTDKNPDNGRNLYRLKQQDINDSVMYSKVIDVQFGNLFSRLHIFPNPATHTVNLAIAGPGYYGGNYSIKFINSTGRVVKSVESSQPEWQGNIGYLQPGTYLVRVVNNRTQNLVGENKFVKL